MNIIYIEIYGSDKMFVSFQLFSFGIFTSFIYAVFTFGQCICNLKKYALSCVQEHLFIYNILCIIFQFYHCLGLPCLATVQSAVDFVCRFWT